MTPTQIRELLRRISNITASTVESLSDHRDDVDSALLDMIYETEELLSLVTDAREQLA